MTTDDHYPISQIACIIIISLCCCMRVYSQKDSVIGRVYFPVNGYRISNEEGQRLHAIISSLKDNKIKLTGRCDLHGDDALNDLLSIRRALAVKQILEENGFPGSNITAIEGLGRRSPVATGSSYTDSLNRVVWIVLLKPEPQNPKLLDSSMKLSSNSMRISAYNLTDSIILVYPPYPDSLLVINKKPQFRDTLRIDTGFIQTGERLIIKRSLFIANDSLDKYTTLAPKEIAEGTKASALNEALLDTILSSQPGQRIIVRALTFEFGYHSLPEDDRASLNALLFVLKRIPDLCLRIDGHVCCEIPGNDAFDKQSGKYDLSSNRAKEIYDYLLSKGVSKDRISYKGYGMQRPMVYPEKGKNDQYRNRRMEFVVLKFLN